jgi:hypothetical protein
LDTQQKIGNKLGQGYVRDDTANDIADTGVINAEDLDGEFDAILAAFVAATGHTHDGTAAEGGAVTVVGPSQEYIAGAGDFSPKADSTYDLGKTAVRWATGYLDDLVLTNALPVAQGGTGSTTAAGARTALELGDAALGTVGTDVQAYSAILANTTVSYTTELNTKLSGVEALADVTDVTNVTAAGAAMLTGAATLTGGFDSTEQALGTITSGTVTPEVDAVDQENFKTLTNNGAFTLAPPSTSSACCIRIHVVNGASAGAVTTSGFDAVFDLDEYATTNAKEYWFYIDHNSVRDTLTIREII